MGTVKLAIAMKRAANILHFGVAKIVSHPVKQSDCNIYQLALSSRFRTRAAF